MTATATGRPHRKSPGSGIPAGGSEGSDRAPTESPVQWPKPVNTSAPTPLASRQGMISSRSCGPPRPAASIIITAATSGLPKMVEIAAAEPAAPSTGTSCGRAARRDGRTASSASPAPIAISGASGPSTAPSGRQASAASTTPGTVLGGAGGPPRPSTGMWPPRPGTRVTIGASSRPASSSAGSGHHQGARSRPRASGRLSQTQCWSWCSRPTNQKAASETGTPTRAEITRSPR